jgi:hypothetical protein
MNEWQQMLQHYFHAKELKAEPEPINGTSDDEKGYYLGALDTSDNYRIGLFYYQIQRGNVARKRVGLRNLVKSFVNPNWGEFDAALVVFDSGSVWRLSFVCDIKGENTAAKRFTYVFGESDNYYNTPVGRFDVLQRNGISFENIKDAFSVERLNKDFFHGYKERYVKFLKHINDDTKENRDYVKKLMGRLVFLQFLQKKGWMGVPVNQQGWNSGDKFYLNHLIERYEGNDRLLSDVLEPLFFKTLNEPRDNNLADARLGENIKIPYLNGGLFDKDELDKKDIDFPYDYFKELMDFFAMYNFTIDENDPEDSEIGIDPEMLGHIFENLLEDNKDKGAFYTPKEIVQYMSKESVAQYLKSNTPEDLHTAIDSLIKQRVVEPVLQNKENARLVNKVLSVVKVCDPAIGSGAFPMGVLNVLFDCRHLLYGFIGKNEDFSYAKVKRDIIQNNIYGVDIEKGAVDIARLRFWLALVVDENEPQPLPNLDYKIMCGDSLLYRFSLDAPFQNVLRDYNQKNGTHYTLDHYRQWVYDYTDISDHTQKDDFRQRIEDIKHAFKTELSDKEKGKIAKVRGTIENLKMEDLFGGKKKENEKKIKALQNELKALEKQREEIENNKQFEHAFEWRFEFPALLNDEGVFSGFDIIIGNPPYGAKLSDLEKDIYKEKFADVHMRSPETFCYFTSLAFKLCAKSGSAIVSYIVPNNIFFQNENEKTRELLSLENMLIRAINLGDNTFENADVPTCIFVGKAKRTKDYNIAYSDYRDYNVKKIEWDDSIDNIKIEKLQTVPALVIGMSNSEIDILNAIKENGITVDSIAEEMACGISSGGDKIFRVSKKYSIINNFEQHLLRKVLVGADIDKYQVNDTNHVIIYSTKESNTPDYINIYNYLKEYESKLSTKRETKKGTLPWWCLHWPRYKELFDESKIIMRQTSDSIRCVFDDNGYYTLDSILILKVNNASSLEYKFICNTLNSKLTNYVYKRLTQEEGRTFAQVKPANVRKLYIPNASEAEQRLLATLYDYMVYLRNSHSPAVDNVISNQFIGDYLERIIDGCVYELFFKEHMIERQINIIDYLYRIIKPLVNVTEVTETISSVFDILYKTDNEVRTRLNLFVSRSPEYLKNIIQS